MERKVSAMISRRQRAGDRGQGRSTTIQPTFIWGSAAILLKPLTTKVEARVRAGSEALDFAGEAVVEEDLVDDEREVVAGADSLELVALGTRGGVAGGVVGMDEDEGAGAGADAALELGEIDPPAEVLEQRVGIEADVVEIGEEVEEWIAGLRDQHGVSGIAEQAKEEAVRFAGAGGQDQVFGIDWGVVAGVVGGDGLAGAGQALRVRVVSDGSAVCECT